MKFWISAIAFGLFATHTVTANANDAATAAADDAERVEHYQPEKPKDEASAKRLLQEKIDSVDTILKDKTLTDSALESIHKESYSLEAAVDALRASASVDDAKLDTVDEAVQALHYASENHEEAKVRQWFTTLQTSAKAIQ